MEMPTIIKPMNTQNHELSRCHIHSEIKEPLRAHQLNKTRTHCLSVSFSKISLTACFFRFVFKFSSELFGHASVWSWGRSGVATISWKTRVTAKSLCLMLWGIVTESLGGHADTRRKLWMSLPSTIAEGSSPA